METIAPPVRRHPGCENPRCRVCLEDHESLAQYIAFRVYGAEGGPPEDWLARYRAYLDSHGIEAEENGWGSLQAFDPANIEAFVATARVQR